MSEKETKLKGVAVKVAGEAIDGFAFAGRSKRFQVSGFTADAGDGKGLFSFVFSFVKRGAGNFFKLSGSEWITVAVIVFIWAGTGILRSLNIESQLLKVIAFFTASYNGLKAGTLEIAGGIAAKSFLLAGLSGTLIPLVTSLFSKRRKTEYAGFSRFTAAAGKVSLKKRTHAAVFLFGTGAAFALYSFLSVDGSFQNNFVAIVAAISLVKNYGRKNSFLYGALTKVTAKTSIAGNGPFIVMSGMLAGFILSVPVSIKLSFISGIGYIAAGVAFAVGIVLLIAGKPEKKGEQGL